MIVRGERGERRDDLSLTDPQIGISILQTEPATVVLSSLHAETRGVRISAPPRSAQGNQPMEQIHLGPGVYAQGCPALPAHSRVCTFSLNWS
jgi:hypothetical protein